MKKINYVLIPTYLILFVCFWFIWNRNEYLEKHAEYQYKELHEKSFKIESLISQCKKAEDNLILEIASHKYYKEKVNELLNEIDCLEWKYENDYVIYCGKFKDRIFNPRILQDKGYIKKTILNNGVTSDYEDFIRNKKEKSYLDSKICLDKDETFLELMNLEDENDENGEIGIDLESYFNKKSRQKK